MISRAIRVSIVARQNDDAGEPPSTFIIWERTAPFDLEEEAAGESPKSTKFKLS